MKKIITYVVSAMLLMGGTTGCNYLDIVPDNTVEVTSLFENSQKAYQALTACYSYMPNFEKLHESVSLAGDEYLGRLDLTSRGEVRGERIMRGWQNSNDPILSYWDGRGGARSLYEGIRLCNIFFQNIDQVPDLTPAEKTDMIAQVKVLKAYYHFFLIRLYGPIVIVDTNLEPDASVSVVRQKRQPVDDCFQYVLDQINSVLYDEDGNEKDDLYNQRDDAHLGQIDKVIAKAIKADVLLTWASPLFNGNTEYYSNFKGIDGNLLFNMTENPERWKEALDAIDDAIKSAELQKKGLYEFTGNIKFWDQDNWEQSDIIKYCYNNRFSITDPWNKELIWGYSGLDFTGQGGFAHATNMRMLSKPGTATFSWQWLGATYRMTELFYTKNGVPIDEDKTFDYDHRQEITTIPDDTYHKGYMQPGESTINLHLNREPRFYAWVCVDRCIWRTHNIANDVKMRYNESPGGKSSSHRTDYYYSAIAVKKMVHPESENEYWQRVVKYPYPIYRLADLYLMYAEAYNEYYGPDQKVYDKLNAVRKRAGLLRPIEEVWNDGTIVTSVGKHLTKDGLRDIIQTERLIELSFEGHRYFDIRRWKRGGDFWTSPIQGWNPDAVDVEAFYILQTLQEREWKTPQDYLFPIPLDEMNKNPNLVQNPGW